ALRGGDRRGHARAGGGRSAHSGGLPWRLTRSRSTASMPSTATATCCTASRSRSSPAACSASSDAMAPARPPACRPSWASWRRGAISLYGEAVVGLPPDVIARKGICLVPQGRRMFRSLTVRENLMVAAQSRTDGGGSQWSLQRVFQLFPRLSERHAQLAGSLS